MILIDSNIVVAAVHEDHMHYAEATAFFARKPAMLLAAHSYAEAYVTLTKRSGREPMNWTGTEAFEALASIAAMAHLVSLSPAQTVEAIEAFAEIGIGARLYDYLIGWTGLVHGATAIVTFNLGHMGSLFPEQRVRSPAEYLREIA